MKLSPRILPGSLHAHNRQACDWGWQSFIAYGCQNFVVVLDPKSVQIIQVLNQHSAVCTKVKWPRENYHHDFASPYQLRLASGDAAGHVIIWDVVQGTALMEFSDGNKAILDLEWLASQDACHDLLVVLHSPSSIVLWNADTGTKLWKKVFQESLLCFAFDPFTPSNVTLMCQDWILFINDFSINKAPESNGRRFYLTSSGTPSPSGSFTNFPNSAASPESRASTAKPPKSALARVKLWAAGEARNRSGEENVALSECLQLAYLPSSPHHLLVLFPREVMVLDMEINQAVCSFTLERNSPAFTQVIPCRQREVLMCLHENGSVIVRVRRKAAQNPYFVNPADDNADTNTSMDIVYESKCQSDPLRLSKTCRLHGFMCCPISECKLALLTSDGRLIIWKLKTNRRQPPEQGVLSEEVLEASLPSPELGGCQHSSCVSLADMVPPPLTSGEVLPNSATFKFVMCSMLTAVTSPTCAAMCPPLTTKNFLAYKPLLAVGTSQGSIQVFNLSTGLLTREYSIHTGAVRGIAWSSLESFFSWAQPSGISSKNELQLLDLTTGRTVHLKLGKAAEESIIEGVKISHLKQYFFVMFKDKPMQLWDLRALTVIREMPRSFPAISALEWSPSHHSKHSKKKLSQSQDSNASDIAAHVLDPTHMDAAPTQSWVKEQFVCTDHDRVLYHFQVDGTVVKDGSKVQSDTSSGSVSCITWKGETLVLADVDGNLSVWDLKARLSRGVPTHRGAVRKLKFGPGRGNFKLAVLYSDGLDVWDLSRLEVYSSYKLSKDTSTVVDMDWLASDLPVIVHANGSILVIDEELKRATSAMPKMDLNDRFWCPYILETKACLVMKALLQHQLGRKQYSLDDITDLEVENEEAIQSQLNVIPRETREFLSKTALGTAQKCLLTARLFGDEAETTFWEVALHYLRREKARLLCPLHQKDHRPPVSRPRSPDLFNPSESTAKLRRTSSARSLDLLSIDDDLDFGDREEPGAAESCCCYPVSLDTCFEIICDTDSFQKSQLDRLALHDSKRSTYEHTKKCADTLVLLGQADRAVQLFLETDANNDNYYVDSLRACLVATIRSSGASQSTIKLVATNLIASGKLSEGVQLLCLIDKGMDACRYLQTYGEWEQASWLAKATLNYPDCAEVMRRWVEHLSIANQQSKAVLVLLSLGKFYNTLDMLYSMRYFDRAAMFAEACQEFGFLSPQDEKNTELVHSVYAEYGRYLQLLGLKKAARYFGSKAGDKGKQLLEGF